MISACVQSNLVWSCCNEKGFNLISNVRGTEWNLPCFLDYKGTFSFWCDAKMSWEAQTITVCLFRCFETLTALTNTCVISVSIICSEWWNNEKTFSVAPQMDKDETSSSWQKCYTNHENHSVQLWWGKKKTLVDIINNIQDNKPWGSWTPTIEDRFRFCFSQPRTGNYSLHTRTKTGQLKTHSTEPMDSLQTVNSQGG